MPLTPNFPLVVRALPVVWRVECIRANGSGGAEGEGSMGGSHGFHLQLWELVTGLIRTELLPILQELSNGSFAVLLQHRKVWGGCPKRDLTVACQHFKGSTSTEPLASPGTSTCKTDCEICSRNFAPLWRPGVLPPVGEKGMSSPHPGPRFMSHTLRLRTGQIRQWQDCPWGSERPLCRPGMWVEM